MTNKSAGEVAVAALGAERAANPTAYATAISLVRDIRAIRANKNLHIDELSAALAEAVAKAKTRFALPDDAVAKIRRSK